MTDVFGRPWTGRRVSVVGLGRSGLAAAQLLCRVGARVRVTEARQTPGLEAAAQSLRPLGIEAVELGGHNPHFLEPSELVVVSPGVSESAAPIRWAAEQGVPVISEIELAFHFCPSRIVAVTGTNGKSTAVTLLAQLLTVSHRAAVACGNLGIPFSSVIDRLTSHTIAVVEVSSFQLLWCHQFRPAIGVLLNIDSNHLDRHADANAYVAAKARLFQRQTPEDWAVLNGRDPRIVTLEEQVQAQRVWFGENRTNPPALRLAEETRRALTEGAQAILQVARLLQIPDPLAWQVIRSFRGLEHRLEHVATIRGIRFVNDSKSTTPGSLLFALAQIAGEAVVILGGRDKGLDFHPLVEPLRQPRIKGMILIGEARQRLRALLNGSSASVDMQLLTNGRRRSHAAHPVIQEGRTLDDAVRLAMELAGAGTTVLFSPACASFDMFRDFEERGRAFKAIVRAL